MKKRLYLMVVVVGIAAQFGVLGVMIARREFALKRGSVCRFRTAPVDPYDAFRGKFVALDFDCVRGGVLTDTRFEANQRVYLRVGTDTNGLCVIERVADKPDASALWLKAKVQYCLEDYKERAVVPPAAKGHDGGAAEERRVFTGKYRTHLRLPFDRFYMDEQLAPEAENAYRDAARPWQGGWRREAVVAVRVWHGVTVIESLTIDGRLIQDIARERLNKP